MVFSLGLDETKFLLEQSRTNNWLCGYQVWVCSKGLARESVFQLNTGLVQFDTFL